MAIKKGHRDKGTKSKSNKVKVKPRVYRSHALLVSQQFLAGLLVFAGFLLIMYAASQNFDFSLYKEVKQAQRQNQKEEQMAFKAVSISIPKINKVLEIEDGTYDGKRWVVSQEGVSYYTESSLPKQGGNTVLYGHNKARILGGLVAMKKGDKIDLTLDNGEVLSYEVSETKTIKPNQVDILNQTKEAQLTIYTCTGFLDSARFVVIAKPL